MPAKGTGKNNICSKADKRIKDQVVTLYDSVRLLEKQVKKANKQLPDEELIVEYNNGGGQSGTRENPIYPAYEKLLASYIKALEALRTYLGEEEIEQLTQLDELKSRFRVAK